MIATLEQELARKTDLLEQRIAEHKEWLAKRQQFSDQVGGVLVKLFARMRPDAAAQQVAVMDDTIAAALLMKLEPKAASAMLSEVNPAKAARLSGIIAAAAEFKMPLRPEKHEAPRDGSVVEKAR